jgi:hypothetical protein
MALRKKDIKRLILNDKDRRFFDFKINKWWKK